MNAKKPADEFLLERVRNSPRGVNTEVRLDIVIALGVGISVFVFIVSFVNQDKESVLDSLVGTTGEFLQAFAELPLVLGPWPTLPVAGGAVQRKRAPPDVKLEFNQCVLAVYLSQKIVPMPLSLASYFSTSSLECSQDKRSKRCLVCVWQAHKPCMAAKLFQCRSQCVCKYVFHALQDNHGQTWHARGLSVHNHKGGVD